MEAPAELQSDPLLCVPGMGNWHCHVHILMPSTHTYSRWLPGHLAVSRNWEQKYELGQSESVPRTLETSSGSHS